MVISPTFDFSRAISSSRSSRSRSFRAVAAPESARSRHSVSLATETFVSRATSSNGSPRNNRATTANLRLTEKRFGPFPSTPEGAPAPAWGERSGAPSGLRPSSFVMGNTPVEVQFTSARCLNYPCRTSVEHHPHHLISAARYPATPIDLAGLIPGACQPKHCPDRLGLAESGWHIDGSAIGQRHHRADTGGRH